VGKINNVAIKFTKLLFQMKGMGHLKRRQNGSTMKKVLGNDKKLTQLAF
jgi:hypothetical protein